LAQKNTSNKKVALRQLMMNQTVDSPHCTYLLVHLSPPLVEKEEKEEKKKAGKSPEPAPQAKSTP
jgi:hypothetical protein